MKGAKIRDRWRREGNKICSEMKRAGETSKQNQVYKYPSGGTIEEYQLPRGRQPGQPRGEKFIETSGNEQKWNGIDEGGKIRNANVTREKKSNEAKSITQKREKKKKERSR